MVPLIASAILGTEAFLRYFPGDKSIGFGGLFAGPIDAIRKILDEGSVMQPGDIQPDPKGSQTLYFAPQLQDKVLSEMEQQFPEHWKSLMMWIGERYETERNNKRKDSTTSSGAAAAAVAVVGGGGCGDGGGGDSGGGGGDGCGARHVGGGGKPAGLCPPIPPCPLRTEVLLTVRNGWVRDGALDVPGRGLTLRELLSLLLIASQHHKLWLQLGPDALGFSASPLLKDGDVTRLCEWAYGYDPETLGPEGTLGYAFRHSMLDTASLDATFAVRSLLVNARAQLAKLDPERDRGSVERIARGLLRATFQGAGHAPDDPKKSGWVELFSSPVLTEALCKFAIQHCVTVGQSVAEVASAVDGVVYDGQGKRAPNCYQPRLMRSCGVAGELGDGGSTGLDEGSTTEDDNDGSGTAPSGGRRPVVSRGAAGLASPAANAAAGAANALPPPPDSAPSVAASMQRQSTAIACLQQYNSDAGSDYDSDVTEAAPEDVNGAVAAAKAKEMEAAEDKQRPDNAAAAPEDKQGAANAANDRADSDAVAIDISTFLCYSDAAKTLQATRCSIPFGEDMLFADVDWKVQTVAGKGSCLAISILHALAGLDLEALRKQESLAEVNWEAVRRWVMWFDKNDPNCREFRSYVFERLWENNKVCQDYFKHDLLIGPDGEITRFAFNDAFKMALGIASDRGFDVPVPESIQTLDRVQMFAVAVLHPKYQFAKELVRALLALELDNKLGILVATCSSVHGEDRFIYRLLAYQPWVTENAKLLIGTVHSLAQSHVDDEVYCPGMPTRSGRPPPVKVVLKKRHELFLANNNRHHFDAALIRNGVGGALIVSKLVEAEANNAKYDKWLPVHCHVTGNASPGSIMFAKRMTARHAYRRHAGKANSDAETTDEDAPAAAAGQGQAQQQGRAVDLSSQPSPSAAAGLCTPEGVK
jgi:hypothetical protein